MSYPYSEPADDVIVQLVPAAPGWRVAGLWKDEGGPRVWISPVAAFALVRPLDGPEQATDVLPVIWEDFYLGAHRFEAGETLVAPGGEPDITALELAAEDEDRRLEQWQKLGDRFAEQVHRTLTGQYRTVEQLAAAAGIEKHEAAAAITSLVVTRRAKYIVRREIEGGGGRYAFIAAPQEPEP